VAGTKNPDLATVRGLRPDLIVANAEENRQADIDSLREMGFSVWVTDIRTVDQAILSIERLLDAVGATDLEWLARARTAWRDAPTVLPGRRLNAVVPIWRRPWMHVGSDTYAGDVLSRLGIDNVLGADASRYPTIPPENLPPMDLVVLPDEPYEFTAEDGPDAFPGVPTALVSGRLLTWYGPAMVEAPGALVTSLRAGLKSQR
jgi:ABC-type Fe3+-hydroxamate transport system substrate-binding protein